MRKMQSWWPFCKLAVRRMRKRLMTLDTVRARVGAEQMEILFKLTIKSVLNFANTCMHRKESRNYYRS